MKTCLLKSIHSPGIHSTMNVLQSPSIDHDPILVRVTPVKINEEIVYLINDISVSMYSTRRILMITWMRAARVVS